MNDMSFAIVPKSDQLNADDLITGPVNITITGVNLKSGDQPVSINYVGDNGRPYKPCKSMCRVMVGVWGKHKEDYIGKSLTLYRDTTVRFGPQAVGGIRISHMSHIDEPTTVMLTVTRAKRKPYTIQPLKVDKIGGDIRAGIAAANGGTDSLKKYWQSLTPMQRKTFKGDLAKWKDIAVEADRGQQ